MDVYGAGTEVQVSIDLIDAQGNVITPVSASYEVWDETGVQVATGNLVVTGVETSLSVTVSAAQNAVVGVDPYGARAVRLAVVSASGTHTLAKSYVLERAAFLVVPAESGQTEMQAAMLSIAMTDLDSWEVASERERKAALKVAWSRLSRLAYRPWREYDDTTTAASGHPTLLRGNFRLNELTADQWAALPAPFTTALKRAQLVEADIALGGDPVWERRMDGLLSKTVGESSEMFRSGKPVFTAISAQAMRELAGFVDFSMRIGRG